MTKTATSHQDQRELTDADGFGALETSRGCLPLVAMDVSARVSDAMAQTTVRQTFRNALDEHLEATYIFPLPDRAAVTRFQMHVAGRTIDGDLKERGQAREEYDRAIEQGHRAAIAEEERSGVFTLRVGNIPPRETATVELTLVGPLPVADGEATFRFPLVVAPRYTAGMPMAGPSVGDGTACDTDRVPDASRVTPPVLLPGFPNPVRLSLEVHLEPHVTVASSAELAAQVHSSLHIVTSIGGPDPSSPLVVRLQTGERLDRDFILRFPIAGKSIATSLRVAPAKSEKAGVLALTLLPPKLPAGQQAAPRDVVFLLDRSGSMQGWKMVAARRALGRMLDSLLDQDRFALVAFGSFIDLPPQSANGFSPATNRQRWQALEWLGKIDAGGGTEMGPAVVHAAKLFSNSPGGAQRQQILVLVTDGQVSGEDAILRQLTQKTANNMPRIFTVGIDQAVNAGFLQRLADAGRGVCELVESEERLDAAMDRIHRVIGTPVLTNVRLEPVDFDWVSTSLAPERIPDLFTDHPVTIFARHLVPDAPLRLRVHASDSQGQPWSQEVVARAASEPMLLSMWGRAKVRDLEDQYAAGTTRDANKLMQEIVKVSLESHVLSRFTAYVAVDRAEVVNAGGEQAKIVQPVEQPAGWTALGQAIFGSIFSGGATIAKAKRRAAPAKQAVMGFDPGHLTLQEDEDFFCSADSMLQEFTEPMKETKDGLRKRTPHLDLSKAEFLADSAPTSKAFNMILLIAMNDGVSELRCESSEHEVRLTGIVNGQPRKYVAPPKHLWDAIIAHLESLLGFNAAQRDQTRTATLPVSVGGHELLLEITMEPGPHGPAIIIAFPQPVAAAGSPARASSKSRKAFWK